MTGEAPPLTSSSHIQRARRYLLSGRPAMVVWDLLVLVFRILCFKPAVIVI